LELSPLLAFKPTHVEECISRCLTEAWEGIPAIRALLTQEVRQKRFELAGKRFNNYVRFVRTGLREQPGTMVKTMPGMTAETYMLRLAAEGSQDTRVRVTGEGWGFAGAQGPSGVCPRVRARGARTMGRRQTTQTRPTTV
jgi:hypothetical protein